MVQMKFPIFYSSIILYNLSILYLYIQCGAINAVNFLQNPP